MLCVNIINIIWKKPWKIWVLSFLVEKQQGEVNAAFESEVPGDEGTYYTTVASETYPENEAIIKAERDTVLNSVPPPMSDDSQLKVLYL